MKIVFALVIMVAAGVGGWWLWAEWQQAQGWLAEEAELRKVKCTELVVQLDAGRDKVKLEAAVAWLDRMAAHWLGLHDVAKKDLPLMEIFKREFKVACLNSLRLDAYDAFVRMPEAMMRKGAM